MWGKVSYLRKQHDGRDWASNHRPSDLKSNTLTTTPPHPTHIPYGFRVISEKRTVRSISAVQNISRVLRLRINLPFLEAKVERV